MRSGDCSRESRKLLDRMALKTGEHRRESFERDRFNKTFDERALVSGDPNVFEEPTIRQRQR